MTDANDPRGSHPTDPGPPPRGPRQPRDTVMISDVPDAEALAVEAAAARPAPQPALNLSSAALAALGQRYDILDEAGCGSMGQVFKARDRETGETVALKLLKPEIASDQAMMDRFKNELLFARKITHKNVCRVHEFNRLGGIAYTSMEFVEGESLRSVLNRFGGLPLRKAIDLTQQMCSGLKEAHAQGIVHRDLKPENVMIDSRGNVKIMDFGIARSMESLTRTTGAMVGTPAYMAPEQVAGKPVDYRTDIYSLGLILYEVFTGTPAFTADNAVAVAMKQLRESPVPPHEIEPSIPVPIERAILKALEKEPDKRFQSIAELEKVFVAQSGVSAQTAGSSVTGARATHDALAMQQTVASNHSAQTLRIASPQHTQTSRARRIALIVAIVVALLYGLAFAGWARKAKLADQLPPPKAAPAPSLPEMAFAQASAPVVASSSSSARVSSSLSADNAMAGTQNSEPSETVPPSPAPVASTTPVSAPPATLAPKPPAAAASSPPPANAAPSAVQQRADAAFKENQPASLSGESSSNKPQQMGSVLRGPGQSYIWVARFEREDRAQDVSRKIQGLGLKSFILPRRGEDGQTGYVVFTGPVAPAEISSTIDWLKSQGYANVREVKSLGLFNRGGNTSSSPANGQNSQGSQP